MRTKTISQREQLLTFTVADDANPEQTANFRVRRTAYGVTIELLGSDKQAVAFIGADFFNNRLQVVADLASNDSGEHVHSQLLIPDVSAVTK
ncbi:MAG: hypothetical protein JST84_04935 [Acidobacteria bacterium]|nr:hypothetical protein [Acidobacteriota bacterium]